MKIWSIFSLLISHFMITVDSSYLEKMNRSATIFVYLGHANLENAKFTTSCLLLNSFTMPVNFIYRLMRDYVTICCDFFIQSAGPVDTRCSDFMNIKYFIVTFNSRINDFLRNSPSLFCRFIMYHQQCRRSERTSSFIRRSIRNYRLRWYGVSTILPIRMNSIPMNFPRNLLNVWSS